VDATDRYGRIGYSPGQLAAQNDGLRAHADAVLAEALGVRLEPIAAKPLRHCRRIQASPGGGVSFAAGAPGVVVASVDGIPVPIGLRRFSQTITAPIGTVAAGQAAFLRVPPDHVPGRWQAASTASALTLCSPP
jgi:hypothetical protein